MSAWEVVPCLDEGKDQLDGRFPNRDKSSDGSIGNLAHSLSPSSHNPDQSGKPEYRDGDGRNEVRARDFDADLRDSVTMEQVVQLWVKKARSGEMWWIRYIIFNCRIWHRRDGFVSRKYTGSNPHDKHCHVNSDFTQAADQARNTCWYLHELGASTPIRDTGLTVDGKLGPKTIRRWQQIMGTPADGVISPVSDLVKAVQRHLNAARGTRLAVDGKGIRQDGRFYHTTRALQSYLGTPQDGRMSVPVSDVVRALQRRLNEGRF